MKKCLFFPLCVEVAEIKLQLLSSLRTEDSLQTPMLYSGLLHESHWQVFWPFLLRRAYLAYSYFLTWKKD